MNRIRIVITDPLVGRMPEIARERYPVESERIDWVVAESGDEAELMALVPGADIIVGARKGLTAKVLERADRATFIQQCSAGYDNIDMAAAVRKGLKVSNSGSAGVIPVAEHAIMLMLACAKSLPKAHQSMVEGRWIFNELVNRVYELYDKLLGIVGMGQIGTQVAVLAHGLKMRVQYYDPYRKDTSDLDFPVKPVSLEELLRTSDFVTIHTPLTEETYHLIGMDQLRMMKRSAYLINTARGVIVDEEALVQALEKGVIAGAGLDVYGRHIDEPPPDAKIRRLPNVVLTPHVGGASAEDIFRNFYVTSLDNIMRVVRGQAPLYVVSDRAKGS